MSTVTYRINQRTVYYQARYFRRTVVQREVQCRPIMIIFTDDETPLEGAKLEGCMGIALLFKTGLTYRAS